MATDFMSIASAVVYPTKVGLPAETDPFYDAETHPLLRCGRALEIGGCMKRKVRLQVGILTLALTVPCIVITPIVGYAQTDSKERRDDRQGDRQGSRDTNQE